MNGWEKTTWMNRFFRKKNRLVIAGIAAAVLLAVVVLVLALVGKDKGEDSKSENANSSKVEAEQESDVQDDSEEADVKEEDTQVNEQEDPQTIIIEEKPEGNGAKVDVSEVVIRIEPMKSLTVLTFPNIRERFRGRRLRKRGLILLWCV